MPRGEGVTLEELKFVWRLIQKEPDYSDKAILNEYDRLAREGKLGFPLRTDIRFVRRIRAEYEAAKEILRPYLEAQVDPIVAERKKEHWDGLVEEAKKLRRGLSIPAISWLRLVELRPGGPVLSGPYEGVRWFFDEVEGKPIVRLRIEGENPLLIKCLLEHLDAEFLEFSKRLERWKLEAGRVIEDCRRLSIEISGKVKKIEDKHPEVKLGAGCSAAIYNWVMEHFGREGQYPEVEEKMVYENRVELSVGAGQGIMRVLGIVPFEKRKRWERALNSLIKDYIKEPKVAEILSGEDRLKEIVGPLRDNLSLVINGRPFRGTCCICRGMRVG